VCVLCRQKHRKPTHISAQILIMVAAACVALLPFAFFSKPEPPPPPEPALDMRSFAIAGGSLFLAFAATMGVAYYYISRNWQKWLTNATKKAFEKTDIDRSGSIDRTELYTGVLEMYLQLLLRGIKVRPPTREGVLKIVDTIDTSRDNLDMAEFEEVLSILLKQTLSRFCAQIGLTVLCPFTSSHVCAGVKAVASQLALLVGFSAPAALVRFTDVLPPTLDETIMTGVMMMSIYPLQRVFDQRAEASANAAARKGS
jgi:hypothetical protein